MAALSAVCQPFMTRITETNVRHPQNNNNNNNNSNRVGGRLILFFISVNYLKPAP